MPNTYNVEADAAIWPRALHLAQQMLMTGPRAQAPSFRATRKIARRIVNGCRSPDGTIGAGRPWRSFPKVGC